MLFRSTKLSSQELEVIEAIGKLYKATKYALTTPPRWTGLLHRNMLALAIRGSNSIEGYLVSKEDAIAAVEGEEPLDAEAQTWLEVIGYRNAMTFVLQLAKDPQFTFNEGFLRSLHFMMLQHDLSKHPGNWRPGPIYVRDEAKQQIVYEAPQIEKVARLIEELIQYLRESEDSDHILVKGAMAHLNLVMIHPFSDGNGRMARCLQTLVLAIRGVLSPPFCSIEEYLGRNRQDYYDALAAVGQGSWNPKNDTRKWIQFNLTAHYRQAVTLRLRFRVFEKLWGEMERLAQAKGLPERSIPALSDAAMGYHMRSLHYRNAADVSVVVASRDLNALVKSGLFISKGEKRGRVYTASDELRNIYLKIREQEPRGIPDPFMADAELITA